MQLKASEKVSSTPPKRLGLFLSESISDFDLKLPVPIPKLSNPSLLLILKSLLATPYIDAKSLASPHRTKSE